MGNGLRQWGMLAAFILVCFAAAGLGSLATFTSVGSWYQTLRKPPWNPPDWIFGPVWSFLYLSMGVAAWLVWRSGSPPVRTALSLFFVQLALNVAWSVIFFGVQKIGPAFAEIILLWASILATLVSFWRVAPVAGILLVPYIAWVTFAAFLNCTIWTLNK